MSNSRMMYLDQKKLEQILSKLSDSNSLSTSKDITKAIDELRRMERNLAKAKNEAEQREKEEEERRKDEEKKAHIDEVTCMDLPMSWENVFDTDERAKGVHTDSISDALVMSLTTLGEVNIEYISSITGEDYKTVILTLKGSIYQNPDTWNECFYKGWETSDEYLSGNLIRKWKAAQAADARYNGYFHDNLVAIEKVLPPAVSTKDIYVTLGSPWVPSDVIDDFIESLLCPPKTYGYKQDTSDCMRTCHDELTGTWEIPHKTYRCANSHANYEYGTNRINFLTILEKTLNMKSVVIFDEVTSYVNKSGKKKVINKAETAEAMEKQKKLVKAFRDWVWKDPKRRERLETIYEERFSCVKRRVFDGSFLTFPTMSPKVQLYPYQKDAVARMIFAPNTLLAHDVGAGKTYEMIAAGQEMRRMGLSKKNMYVVPNNIVGQWRSIFMEMYPDARILCVTPNMFGPKKREYVLERIRDDDFDGIIIAYSCFERIPLSKHFYVSELHARKNQLVNILKQKNKATSMSQKKLDKINEDIEELLNDMDDMYDVIYFDELGITRLFVDEAHNFKNIPFETKTDNVLGINSRGSKKCNDMLLKVHWVQKENDGKGVIFATGTPITNSVTDAYVMQLYLQSGELGLLDLQSFDAWIGMFAEMTTEFEIDVDTSSYRLATRFAKFHNLPELTSLLGYIADFHQVDRSAGIPDCDGHKDALISKSKEFKDFLKDISQRADEIRNGNVSRREDNMLKLTTDGRKAALDMRLIDSSLGFTYQSKVARCADNVFDIYMQNNAKRSTQIVFCDTSTPDAKKFNMYDELKNRLVMLGMSPDLIAFVHDYETETARAELFKKMRNGDIRVLIGSTFKLGLGVNVQDKLIAMHHLDVPWRPADMTQREGRILRQGNTNPKVYIYRYITEGSFDAYSWQLLETKQRFISALLSGSLVGRDSTDIDDTVLDYADVRLLLFNPIDLRGIPTSNEDKTLAVWLRPKIFQMDPSDCIINILFLDEISAAPQSVQAAAYQITLDRTVGEHRLPDNCIVIAAGNRVTDKSVAFKMPKALANRLLHIEVEGNFKAWKKWAITSGINDKVIGFLSFRQNYLMGFDSGSDDLAFPTPRAWEMVSNVLNNINSSVEEMYMLIAGIVGTGVATEFRTWASVYKELPDIEDIFDGKMPAAPTRPDAIYALTSSMVSYAREHKNEMPRITNSIRYAEKLPPDFSVVLLKDYMYIEEGYKEKLIKVPEFNKWLQSKGSLLNGSVR